MAKKISTPAAFLKGLKHLSTEQLLASQDQSALHHLWRAWFVTQRSSGLAQGGFILPTVTLLLLMVSLIIGLLISRTYSRTAQVAGDRQQTALYNAATPAIDRGKAKLEYMFREAGLSALPSDDDLERELLKARYNLPSQSNAGAEERVDIDGNGTLDNAWIYETDVDGDGTIETVAYSIMSNASRRIDTNDDGVADTTVEIENSDPLKASSRVVRNGPINLETSNKCPNTQGTPASGWESTTDSSQLRKALQVHAIVLDDADATNSVFATLEMQQDRQAELGNKWGAWFRYDIVASPFARFNFNGAMHTEGSIALVPFDNTRPGNFLYLVSSPSSCIYNLAASEVSVGSRNLDDDGFDFQGQVLQVDYRNDSEITNGLSVDRFVARPNNLTSLSTDASITGPTIDRILLSADTNSGNTRKDSVIDSTKFSDVALNPIVLFTQGISEALGSDPTNATRRTTSTEWDEEVSARSVGNGEYGRIFSSDSPLPFLDDTYRADNRGGPKPVYNNQFSIPSTVTLGSTLTDSTLTENDPLAKSPPDEMGYGLDGYWERRARRTGVRIIVGQRLELGNANEWLYEDLDLSGGLNTLNEVTDSRDYDGDNLANKTAVAEDLNGNSYLDVDPLYPAGTYTGSNMAGREHEALQMRMLRDNLAAAQATAIYHYKNNYDYPVACLATTAHPGTAVTDANSRTVNFVDTTKDGVSNPSTPSTDFYEGEGTNGIEFAPPFAGNASTFETQLETSNSALRIALTNLAYFAGDPSGAFPPTQDSNTGQVHPYPALTMWGNFSELRRVITALDAGADYSTLSPADKATLHTATCTIGMLAYATQVKTDEFGISVTNDTGNDFSALTSFYTNARQLFDGTANASVSSKTSCPGVKVAGSCSVPEVTTYSFKGASNPEIWQVASTGDQWTSTGLVCGSDDDTGVVLRAKNGAWPWSNIPAAGLDSPDPTQWTAAQIKAFMSQFNTAQWACGLGRDSGAFSTADAEAIFDDLKDLITVIQVNTIFQLDRDRALGFVPGSFSTTVFEGGYGIEWDPVTGKVCYDSLSGGSGTGSTCTYSGGETTDVTLTTGCNPDIVRSALGGSGGGLNDRSVMIALALCGTEFNTSQTFPIRYPSLFYLFPFVAHTHEGDWLSTAVTAATTKGYDNPTTTPQTLQTSPRSRDRWYAKINDPYIYNAGSSAGVNYYKDTAEGTTRFYFRPVEDGIGNGNGVVDGTENMSSFVTYLGITPRDPSTPTNWATPVTSTATGRVNTITYNGTNYYPAFLDMGLYNGRERMSVRTLSIDLDLLRRTRLNNASGGCTYTDPEPVAGVSPDASDNNGLCWLPLPTLLEPSNAGATHTTGLIYAFREDAVREDAIARPTRADASGLTCDADDTLGTKDEEEWAQEWNTYAKTVSDDTDSDQKIEILESNGSGFDPFDLVLDAVGLTGYFDPPVDPCTKISPKPVDFYNDPDRRPHGFVLRNGQDLRRSNTAGTTFDTDYRGMSFVSDNPVYIWGDLNYHSTNGTFANRIEEFSTLLIDSWSNFYSRSTLNTNFATGANDTWRQTEIIADAVTVLSKDFIPGFIIEGLLWSTDPNTTPNSATSSSSTPNSYGGMGIPRTIANPTTNTIADLSNSEQADALGADSDSTADTVIANCATETPASTKRLGRQCWLLENGTQVGTTALASVTSPIALNRNGFPLYQASGTTYAYGSSTARSTEHFEEIGAVAGSGDVYRLTRSRIPRVSSTDNMINAVVISGISPSRVSQQNGGIVNFLRFNESWDTDPADGGTKKILRFAGSLYQLNFSSYAGAFDQITWEPGEVNANDNGEFYYKSPTLNYGYDPALLYVPAGPVARRFTTPGRTRSEFYRELAVDDPYILNLRCAYKSGGITRVDPNVNTSLCSN